MIKMTHRGYWAGNWDLTCSQSGHRYAGNAAAASLILSIHFPHCSSENFSCRLSLVFSIFTDQKRKRNQYISCINKGLNASGKYFRKSYILGRCVVLSLSTFKCYFTLFSSGDAHVPFKTVCILWWAMLPL